MATGCMGPHQRLRWQERWAFIFTVEIGLRPFFLPHTYTTTVGVTRLSSGLSAVQSCSILYTFVLDSSLKPIWDGIDHVVDRNPGSPRRSILNQPGKDKHSISSGNVWVCFMKRSCRRIVVFAAARERWKTFRLCLCRW